VTENDALIDAKTTAQLSKQSKKMRKIFFATKSAANRLMAVFRKLHAFSQEW